MKTENDKKLANELTENLKQIKSSLEDTYKKILEARKLADDPERFLSGDFDLEQAFSNVYYKVTFSIRTELEDSGWVQSSWCMDKD